MIDIAQDIPTLTDCKRQSTSKMRQLKKSGWPVVLNRLSAMEGISRGLAQAKKDRGRSVDEVFDTLDRD